MSQNPPTYPAADFEKQQAPAVVHHTSSSLSQPGSQAVSPVPQYAAMPAQPQYAVQYVASPMHPGMYAFPMAPRLRADPVVLDCPRCRATVQTSTESRVGGMTWVWALVGCVIGCPFGVPCIGAAVPFCIDGCKDVEHTCPACGFSIGKYSRL